MNKDLTLPAGQTTTDLIADALRAAIVEGLFFAGQELTQEELAAQFGVSRVPLREAMRRLEAEGLISFLANRGAFVTELSCDDVKEIYQLRKLIEGDLIYRSVRALAPIDLRKAESIHDALGREKEPKVQNALNRAFHSALYAPARRPKQQAIVNNLRNLVERYHDVNRLLMASTRDFQVDHKRILTACRQKNARKARALLVKHLENAMKVACKQLNNRKV